MMKTSIGTFDSCPRCGQSVMSGAMRCPKCRALLKTPEEQIETMRKLKESKRPFSFKGLVKFLVFITLLGAVYFYYGDAIVTSISRILGK